MQDGDKQMDKCKDRQTDIHIKHIIKWFETASTGI